MTLRPQSEHPNGVSGGVFDALFTTDCPILFAVHGYPWLIHRLTYRRTNHGNLHVRRYKERGTATTPFDMVVTNVLDRFHLVLDVIPRVPGLARDPDAGRTAADCRARLAEHRDYIREHGEDTPGVRNWQWSGRVNDPG